MKVLIVDDEYQACEGMVNRVQRMKLRQVDEIFYVTDAKSAIEKVECDPEESWIIITDIQMPGMDGLKMIREMQSRLIDASYIVFSAFQEFDYAKEAIRLKVVEYLLKPCRYEELKETMLRILESMEYRQRLEKKAENKLNDLLTESDGKEQAHLEDLKELLGKLNMDCYEAYTVVSLYPDVSNIKSFRTIYPMMKLNDGMEILVNHPTEACISQLIRLFRDGWAGVSTRGGLSDFSRMLKEARRALKDRILSEPGTVIYYENIQADSAHIVSQLLVKNLNADLLRQGEKAVKDVLEEIFAETELKRMDGHSVKKLFVMLHGVLYSLKAEMMLHGEVVDKDFGEFESYENMKSYIIEEYCALAREVKNAESETVVVQWAKEYIKKNLDKEISMAVIANHFDMNYYYFSRLFRTVTGQTFSQYVLKKRMQLSAKLLSENISIQETAERTGYQQVKNFSRAFHNYYRMSPSEWRKRQEK